VTVAQEAKVTIQNKLGMHVRPSQQFAETAGQFDADIQVSANGTSVDGKSSIELLMLAAVPGTELILRAEGSDAQDALQSLSDLVAGGFGEE
jgi:phosphocarrier protein